MKRKGGGKNRSLIRLVSPNERTRPAHHLITLSSLKHLAIFFLLPREFSVPSPLNDLISFGPSEAASGSSQSQVLQNSPPPSRIICLPHLEKNVLRHPASLAYWMHLLLLLGIRFLSRFPILLLSSLPRYQTPSGSNTRSVRTSTIGRASPPPAANGHHDRKQGRAEMDSQTTANIPARPKVSLSLPFPFLISSPRSQSASFEAGRGGDEYY